MYIAVVRNRSSPPALLLRESYRSNGKVCSRTLANLTRWPAQKVEAFRRLLNDETLTSVADAFHIERSLPHGHVLAVLGTLRRLGLDRLSASTPSPQRSRVLAMIVARVIDPRSKLATARGLADESAFSTLAAELKVSQADEDELYEALDWLVQRQPRIEAKPAARHLKDGTLVLYDLTSVWYEGRLSKLVKFGYSRDGKKGKPQIILGLLCDADGCPVAVEVFEGHTADPSTLPALVRTLRERFGLKRIVLVGDRGLITQARIEQDLRPVQGLDWITALRAPAIRELAEQKYIQPSLFDQRDLAEIQSPDYPGERLIACLNPLLAEERKRKRAELIAVAEEKLQKIVAATQRAKRPLKGAAAIGLRVGRALARGKVARYFTIQIEETSLGVVRNAEAIAVDDAIDGIYVIRTSVPAQRLDAAATAQGYKRLSAVERAIRSLKTVDLKVRPIHHRLDDRIRAHVFLCMLAYYVEWHMRQALAPLLFDDEDKAGAAARRASIVQPAQRSEAALRKAATRRTSRPAVSAADSISVWACGSSPPSSNTGPATDAAKTAGEMRTADTANPADALRANDETRAAGEGQTHNQRYPVHSFQTLLKDLATLTRNHVRLINPDKNESRIPGAIDATTTLLAAATPLQTRAFELLQVRLAV
jgi:hypothetical protein